MPTATQPILLTHRLYARWPLLLSASLLGTGIYFLMSVVRLDGQLWRFIVDRNALLNLGLVLGYYVPFECLSLAVFVSLLRRYHAVCQLRTVTPTHWGVLRYELLQLPLIGGSILLFAPLTNTLRYGLIHFPHYQWTEYFPEFVMTVRMYFNYLLPLLILGYLLINLNLLLDYRDALVIPESSTIGAQPAVAAPPAPQPPPGQLVVYDSMGQTRLAVVSIGYITVAAKAYQVHTRQGTYRLRGTLAELEAELPPIQFYRVNRSVILNLDWVKNYSFWEHDKYIIRLKQEPTEFVMQRARLKAFQERWSSFLAEPPSQAL